MISNEEWVERFLKVSSERLAESYRLVASELTAAGIEYLAGDAGFFIWAKLLPRATNDDQHIKLWHKLLDAGVYIAPPHAFTSPENNWFVVVDTLFEIHVDSAPQVSYHDCGAA